MNSVKGLANLKALIESSPTKIEGLGGYKVISKPTDCKCVMCLATDIELRERSLDAKHLKHYQHIPQRYLYCTDCSSEWVSEDLVDWNKQEYDKVVGLQV